MGLATRALRRGFFGLAGCLAFSRAAFAQGPMSDEELRSRGRSHALHSMYGELQRLSQAGQHARALEIAERAAAIEMTPSLRRVIVHELVALGRWTRAASEAQRCLRDAGPPEAPRIHPVVVAGCRDALARATAHTGALRVVIAGEIPGDLSIFIAGESTDRALLGAPLVVDAGAVHLELRAAGHRPIDEQVTVAARETVTRAIVLQPTLGLVIVTAGASIARALAPQPPPAGASPAPPSSAP